MDTQQDLMQLENIVSKAIVELYQAQDDLRKPLRHIETALVELQDGVRYLKERLNND